MANWATRLAKLAQALGTAGEVPDTQLSTAEMDTDLRLAPDGAGGMEWGTGGASGGRAISRTQSIIQEEMIVQPPGVAASGTGGAGFVTSTAGHPGIFTLHTAASGTARMALLQTNYLDAILLGASKIRFGLIGLQLAAISDGTERYTLRMGLGDLATGDHTDGVYFRVVDNVNGGNWQGVCRSNTGESVVDLGVTPDADTWHLWEFEINDAATSVEFFIDGVSCGTLAASIPTGAGRGLTIAPAGIYKALGTTRRDFYIDAYWYYWDFATPRSV